MKIIIKNIPINSTRLSLHNSPISFRKGQLECISGLWHMQRKEILFRSKINSILNPRYGVINHHLSSARLLSHGQFPFPTVYFLYNQQVMILGNVGFSNHITDVVLPPTHCLPTSKMWLVDSQPKIFSNDL